MIMSLLVRPHRVVLPILLPGGILLTRLVIGVGVHVTQVVAGADRCTVHHACICRCACGEDYYVPHADGGMFVRVSGCVCCVC